MSFGQPAPTKKWYTLIDTMGDIAIYKEKKSCEVTKVYYKQKSSVNTGVLLVD